MRSLLLIVAVLSASAALAHPRGFHKLDRIVVHPDRVEVLVTLEVDGGRRAQLLRAGVDLNRDGEVGKDEARKLKQQLTRLAVRPLKVSFSGYEAALAVVEAKVSLRGDRRVTESGVSIAVLMEAPLPAKVLTGMELVVADESPDGTHVRVEAQQAGPDGGVAQTSAELQPGERLTWRLPGAM